MLALGVFGGKYMTDCREEFPADWFAGAKLSPARRDPSLNYFGVDASQPSRSGAARAGSILTIRAAGSNGTAATTLGRRMPEEDARQIKRWKAIRRHVAQIRRHCEPGDRAAGRASARRCCNGRTTAARSEALSRPDHRLGANQPVENRGVDAGL